MVERDADLGDGILLNGRRLKEVEELRYMVTMIVNNGGMEMGSKLCRSVKHLVWNWNIPRKAKVTMFKTYYRPMVTYC